MTTKATVNCEQGNKDKKNNSNNTNNNVDKILIKNNHKIEHL